MVIYIKENNSYTKKVSIDCIKGATLLTHYEIKYLIKKEQRALGKTWWTSTCDEVYKGISYIIKVEEDGNIDFADPADMTHGVRPALQMNNLEDYDLNEGDEIEFGGCTFTILNKRVAICDRIIGQCQFNKDRTGPSSGSYDFYKNSDIKKYIDNWFNNVYKNEKQILQVQKGDKSIFADSDWGF